MKRSFALMICLAVSGFASTAPQFPPKGGPATSDAPRMLDVQPAAAPVPALKYALLPEVAEMNPGNAVPAYLKCFAEQQTFFFSKESNQERERLIKCPLTDITPGSLKNYGGSALHQADYAARLEYADWNILPQLHRDGYAMLLPEVQQMRTLANALAVRGRGQIVDKDYDGAIGTLKTLFALAHHMGQHPTLITGLVGAAIAQVGCNLLEELIQQPGAPNLYWAIVGLPGELVDLRKAASADRMIAEWGLAKLLDKAHPWTAEELPGAVQTLKEFASVLEIGTTDRGAAEKWILGRVDDAEWLTTARKELTDAGYPADAVAKYPPQQVILHRIMRKAKVENDEMLKWIPLPYWQAAAGFVEMEQAPPEIEVRLARQLMASIPKVKGAHARLEQRFAMLRIVEAIRMDAAKNGGKLPASLNDLSVPVSIDPVSGKSFEYKVDGMTAILTGKEVVTGAGRTQYRYEIRLRK
jgi:hypothetical protein